MTAHNGNPTRRLRLDATAAPRPAEVPAPAGRHSGRRLVVAIVVGVLVLWGGLSLAFRDWRARYRERAAFGAREVATAIDPLAEVIPPGTDPRDWRQAVAETHAMLRTLTASNLLDRAQMEALRAELKAHVARARPETALHELAAIWDDLARRAGPALSDARHPRPKLLGPRPPHSAGPDRASGAGRSSRAEGKTTQEPDRSGRLPSLTLASFGAARLSVTRSNPYPA